MSKLAWILIVSGALILLAVIGAIFYISTMMVSRTLYGAPAYRSRA